MEVFVVCNILQIWLVWTIVIDGLPLSIIYQRNQNIFATPANNSSNTFSERAFSETECCLLCLRSKYCISVNYQKHKNVCQLIHFIISLVHKDSAESVNFEVLTQISGLTFKGRCFEEYQESETLLDCSKLDVVKTNCEEYLQMGFTQSGIYNIKSSLSSKKYVSVFCDMTTDGGGWIVFQKRFDGSVSFERNWKKYKKGFGNLIGEFWLGLKYIREISQQGTEMRVDLEDRDGKKLFRKYSSFSLGHLTDSYKLILPGTSSGNLTDNLKVEQHDGRPFSTYDADNSNGCVNAYKGGWWYGVADRCHMTNLNGIYDSNVFGTGLNWKEPDYDFTYSFKKTSMKLKHWI